MRLRSRRPRLRSVSDSLPSSSLLSSLERMRAAKNWLGSVSEYVTHFTNRRPSGNAIRVCSGSKSGAADRDRSAVHGPVFPDRTHAPQQKSLLDHLVGGKQKRRRNRHAERL